MLEFPDTLTSWLTDNEEELVNFDDATIAIGWHKQHSAIEPIWNESPVVRQDYS